MSLYNLLCIARHPAFKPIRRLLGLARPSHQIWTDASGQGYGGHLGPAKSPMAVFQHKRLPALNLPKPCQYHSIKLDRQKIELHEATALFLAVHRWRRFLRGSTIEAYMDNMAVCEIYSGKTKGKGQKETLAIVDAIKELVDAEDMTMSLTWISRVENRLADGLSKFAQADDPRVTLPAKKLLKIHDMSPSPNTLVKKMIATTEPITPSS